MAYIGNSPAAAYSSINYQDLTGGSGTSFTLDYPVSNEQEIEVYVNNVRQEPGVAYTTNDTALTMTGTISVSDDFYVIFQGKAQQSTVHPSSQNLAAADGNFTGTVSAAGGSMTGDLTFGDNNKAVFGAGSDLQIYHDGTHSYIADVGTGNFKITGGSDIQLLSTTGESYITCNENDSVDLFFNDSKKLATTATGIEVTGTITQGGSAVKTVGKETIWVPATAMYPETTSGCADLDQVELGNGPELKCLDFDPSSDEQAQFSVAFPKSWNEGTITYQVFFTVTGTDTGTVVWTLSGLCTGDNDSINTVFGTAVATSAKAHSGTSNDLNITAESSAVTISGAASEEMTIFRIGRDVSEDTQTGDARLLGVKIFFTTDAATDA